MVSDPVAGRAANKDLDGARTQKEGGSLQAQIPPDLQTFIHRMTFYWPQNVATK